MCTARLILIIISVGWILSGQPAAAKVIYDPGWFWDSWEVTGPPNTDFKVQLHHRRCRWRTVATGTTDGSGEDSGIVIHWGPSDGYQPFDDAVRVRFSGGVGQGGEFSGSSHLYCANFLGTSASFEVGQAGLTGPNAMQFVQNTADLMNITGQAIWLVDGSTMTIRLPRHFVFTSLPTVQSSVPGELTLGTPTLIEAGRTLQVPVISNPRKDPLAGITFTDVFIAYDGIPLADFYWADVTAPMDLTPSDQPFNSQGQIEVYGTYRSAIVTDWPMLTWFDEGLTGNGFASFAELQEAHSGWVGTPDYLVDFEGFPLGTKITDQYDPSGIWFSGTDGGELNQLTGVQAEGDPAIIQNLTGYDGSYQPDGSQAYVRFDNTANNPDAPVTIEFGAPQKQVSAFLACGTEGSEHSYTVSVFGEAGGLLGSRIYRSELWEQDPFEQNRETLFAVRAALPIIRAVSIENNAAQQFANALILDSVGAASEPGTSFGDYDRDGDVDHEDFLALEACHTAPISAPACEYPDAECRFAFDGDSDADIDLVDFAAIALEFTGDSLWLLPPLYLAGAPAGGDVELTWQTPLFNAPADMAEAELAYDFRVSSTYIHLGNFSSAVPVSGNFPPVAVNGNWAINLHVDAQDEVQNGMMQHDKIYLRAWLSVQVQVANLIPWGYPIPNETITFTVYDENGSFVKSGSGVTDATGMASWKTGDINNSYSCSQPNWPMYSFTADWAGHSVALRNGMVVSSGNKSDTEQMMVCNGATSLPPVGMWSQFGGTYDYALADKTVSIAVPAGAIQMPEAAVVVYEPLVPPPPVGFPPSVPGPAFLFTVEKADGPWLDEPAVVTVTYPEQMLFEYGGIGESSLRAYWFDDAMQMWQPADMPPVAIDREHHRFRFATPVLGTFALAAELDQDLDGLGDQEELQLGLLPGNPDSDGDGLLDGHEVWVTGGDPTDGRKLFAADQVGWASGLPPAQGYFFAGRIVAPNATSPVSNCVYVPMPTRQQPEE
jgi:hypothetical protein